MNCLGSPGKVFITAGMHAVMEQYPTLGKYIGRCVLMHSGGLYGTLCSEDVERNRAQVQAGRGMIMSTWPLDPAAPVVVNETPEVERWEFWIITEADHKSTIILLPSEY